MLVESYGRFLRFQTLVPCDGRRAPSVRSQDSGIELVLWYENTYSLEMFCDKTNKLGVYFAMARRTVNPQAEDR